MIVAIASIIGNIIPHRMKILHGIKVYGFTVAGRAIKLTFTIMLQRYSVALILLNLKSLISQ